DVTGAFEPYTTTFQENGLARAWRRSGDISPDTEASIVLFSPQMASAFQAAGRQWMVAYLKGVRDYTRAFASNSPPDDVVQAMVTHSNIKDVALVRKLKAPGINPDGYPYKDSLQRTLDFFVRQG